MSQTLAVADPCQQVRHVRVGGMDVAAISNEDLIDLMLTDAPLRRGAGTPAFLVFDVNAHGISLNASDAQFRADSEQADLLHADGQVVVAASRLFCEVPIPDRSATTDMFLDSLALAAKRSVTYYLLGATEDVNSRCAERIQQMAAGIGIAGRRNGFFRGQEDAIIDAINAAAPDVLWVGLGKPLEQNFCVRNRHRLRVGWIVTCGGLFNYVTGDYPRAPRWMQRWGLEWLHRMATKPRQLAWRYLTTNPHALWQIWKLRHERSCVRTSDQ